MPDKTPSPAPVESCPWCWGMELRTQVFSDGRYAVVCVNCDARGPAADTAFGAAQAWNRQAEVPAVAAPASGHCLDTIDKTLAPACERYGFAGRGAPDRAAFVAGLVAGLERGAKP